MSTLPTFNEAIYEIINIVFKLKNDAINKNLYAREGIFHLGKKQCPISSVTANSLTLLGQAIDNKLLPKPSSNDALIDFAQIERFLRRINNLIVGLNHCGVGYACKDIDEEIELYRKLVSNTPQNLYREVSSVPGAGWFFIGDNVDEKSSLFELVLKQDPRTQKDHWYPHFQIDFDTTLTAKEIVELCSEYFGKNFINFTLDISNYGVVLIMGRLGAVDGINVYIGLGTNLRDTKSHRRLALQAIGA